MAPRISIFNMLGPSPISPLEKHMDKTDACAQMLIPFFETVFAQDWENARQHYRQIADLENEADQIKREMRLHLPKSLFLPVPRDDLLVMLMLQDRIANKAKDIAGLVVGRKMQFPDAIAKGFRHLLKRSLDAETQARVAICELDALLETGFKGKEVHLVEAMIIELDKIEHDTDELQIEIRHQLFEIENTLNPVDVIFLYKIIEWTGDLADRAQATGGQLELLLAH